MNTAPHPWKLTTIRKDVRQIDKKIDQVDQKVDNLDQGVQRFESGAKKALTSLSGRLNVVEEDLKELRKEVKDVQSQINNMQRGITNTMALQVNGLRQRLFEPIEPISTPMQIGDEQIFRVPPDFPVTIREFWQLRTKIPTLVQLASHYSVSGRERWQRSTSDDSDVTEYHDLSDAVAAHSAQCLMILAAKWGLRYAELEQPRPKRRTATDDSQPSRRVRARKESSDEVVESIFSRDESGRVI